MVRGEGWTAVAAAAIPLAAERCASFVEEPDFNERVAYVACDIADAVIAERIRRNVDDRQAVEGKSR